MKRTLTTLVPIIVLAATCALGVVPEVWGKHHDECTNASLEGGYGLVQTGNPIDPLTGPLAIVGIAVFDGAGRFSGHFTGSMNGVIGPITVAGEYEVNPDCTFTISPHPDTHFQGVIVNGGARTLQVATSGGPRRVNIQGQDKIGERECTPATLKGAYGFLQTGTINGVGPEAAGGIVTFDGAGNLSGQFTEDLKHVVSSGTFTGTYTVESDCTGSFTFSIGGRESTDDFVIVAGGSEVKYIDTTPGTIITGAFNKQRTNEDDQDD